MKKEFKKVNADYSKKTKAGIVICDLIISILLVVTICVIATLLKGSITDISVLLNYLLAFVQRYYILVILFFGLFFILLRVRITARFFIDNDKGKRG